VFIHGNERARGDLTPIMKHFNAKYYRVLVKCVAALSQMAADYYVTATKSYKKYSKKWRRLQLKENLMDHPSQKERWIG
jgi:hypothetical protein